MAELVPDPRRPAGWTLLVDDVAQSYVDLADPEHLEFAYARQVAAVIGAVATPQDPVRVLHLGAGGLTLARYVAATRPRWRQRVVDKDGALVDLVLRTLPIPPESTIRLDVAEAVDAVDETEDAGVDLVICDVFQGGELCLSVAGGRFAASVSRVLAPGGVYIMNVNDEPPLLLTRVVAATLRKAFADVCVFAEPRVPAGRRYANAVLVASVEPGGLPAAGLASAAADLAAAMSAERAAQRGRRAPDGEGPGRFLHGRDLDTFIAGAGALNGT
jgi:spermidine synthase